jgi:predicted pyridoxine 5'-phosphate oxidase superfamily flavin-nucleotide-binding protein
LIARVKISVIATASRDGKPNVVPLGLTKVISDDEILVMDNYMNKTRANLEANPVAAISVWDLELHMGLLQLHHCQSAFLDFSGKFIRDYCLFLVTKSW